MYTPGSDLITRILEHKPIVEQQENVPDSLVIPSLQAALVAADAPQACAFAVRADPWLAAHMTDLFDKLGVLEPRVAPVSRRGVKAVVEEGKQMRLRDFCVLGYGDVLRSDPGLWRLVVEYWSTCGPEGLGRVRAALRRVVIGIETDQPEAELGVNAAGGAKDGEDQIMGFIGIRNEKAEVDRSKARAGKRPTVAEVREVCREHNLEDEAIRLSKVTLGSSPQLDLALTAPFRSKRTNSSTNDGTVLRSRIVSTRKTSAWRQD